MKNKPLILEIKGNSLDDGPGIRSVVFFKGCPLSCVWCHNPESKRVQGEISFSATDCIGCGTCRNVCTQNALDLQNPYYIDRNKCNLCYECVNSCPAKALTKVGEEFSIDEVLKRLLSDKPFYDASGGGVTLSGGEVTMHMEYAGELLKLLKENGVHTMIETCGQFSMKEFKKYMLPYVDLIYYDLKIINSDEHKKYCGVSNQQILDNFKILFEESKNGTFEILPRTPLIPTISDTDENMENTANFLSSLGVSKTELLPYNPTWLDKNKKLGKEDPQELCLYEKWQSKEKLNRCKSFFEKRNITVL